ncbi:hypothetical protein Acsp06_28100 [Actinomycetospora sp. NBRC 106375]|uniref:tetratricopeptide repeat protein n=1 Tax=Actinomycetospora sp. NBRC 106375 TaxID=3032207 RepID=UPI0024A12DD6|nr:tetratricopeptide repeat protein [Actinomycetospora sp. NBRC 106375]GLZ46625.1 hypothetical protein Acsp06_28100 [Actinomycetospora sp. NBRC 106375]
MARRSCFVISPIRKPGTPEFDHYRALYETVLRPTLAEKGFEVQRADDITKSGAITSDIVTLLASSDLVVADISELNPNVFYELGVRHSLRGSGTIMIVDSTKTEVPFDLKPYRMIEFSSDLRGIEKLREGLVRFISTSTNSDAAGDRDNPVHDTLSSLPDNIYAHAEGSAEGELREEVAQLKRRLQRYTEVYGIEDGESIKTSAIEVVSTVLLQAQRGELPINLFYAARSAARESKHEEFLTSVRQILESKSSSLSSSQLSALARDASTLELPEEIQLVLIEKAIQQNPNDPLLKNSYFGVLARSEDPKSRERARRELRDATGITIGEDGSVTVDGVLEENIGTIGVMLDAYHQDQLHSAALQLTNALVEKFPNNSSALRNHARTQSSLGEKSAAIATYELAMAAPDVADITANWYGGELCRQGDGAAALSPFLRACELDPDDAVNYVRIAEAQSAIVRGIYRENSRPTDHLDVDSVKVALTCAFSCSAMPSGAFNRAKAVVEDLSLGNSYLHSLVALRNSRNPSEQTELMTRKDRVNAVRDSILNT